MASLSDLYTSAPPRTFAQGTADSLLQGSQATAGANISQSIALGNYTNRTLPDLISGSAARGNVLSGGVTRDANRAREDVGRDVGGTQFGLANTLSDMARNRILAAMGISI